MNGKAMDWINCRKKAWDEVSDRHPIKCFCGKLCTGLHERNCAKFQKAVDSRAYILWHKLGYAEKYEED
jgi:hypothetical protein